MIDVIIRKGREKSEKQRHRGLVNREAEISVLLPQAKECLETPEAGKCKERFSP